MSDLGPYSYIRVTDPESDRAKTMLRSSEHVRKQFWQLQQDIVRNVPEGRYRALAITALEESSLWAQRGLALEYSEKE